MSDRHGASLMRLVSIFRWNEWSSSKLPLVFSAWYLVLIEHPEQQPLDSYVGFLGLAAFTNAYLGFGYSVNDLADWSADLQAGKHRRIHELGKARARILVALSAAVALIGAAPVAGSEPAAWGVVVAALLLGGAYSLPPLCLKRRGGLGVIAAPVAQRVLPTCLAFAATGTWTTPCLVLIALSATAGMREILAHQVRDHGADVTTGVSTLAVRRGPALLVKALVRWIAPVEAIAAGALVLLVAGSAPVAVVLSALYLPVAVLEDQRLDREVIVNTVLMEQTFLATFENAWLPLSLTATVVLAGPQLVLLLPVQLLVSLTPLIRMVRVLRVPPVVFYGAAVLNEQPAFIHEVDHPSYFEWWYVEATFTEGSAVSGSVSIRGHRSTAELRGAIDIVLSPPGGDALRVKREDLPIISAGRCAIIAEGFSVERDPEGSELRLRVDTRAGSLALTLLRRSPSVGWVGDGVRFTRGGDRVFSWAVVMPSAEVVGVLPWSSATLAGTGYHDQNWGSVDLSRNMRGWSWVHVGGESYQLVVAEVDFTFCTRVRTAFLVSGSSATCLLSSFSLCSRRRALCPTDDGLIHVEVRRPGISLRGTLGKDILVECKTRKRRRLSLVRPGYRRWAVTGCLTVEADGVHATTTVVEGFYEHSRF